MALFKILKELKEKLSEEETHKPINWLGKWTKSIKIDSIKHKIEKVEGEIQKRKGVGGKHVDK